ncbi:MAG: PqiC family protein [Halieaceae bacterium]|nr:PqiC family protein [Halieaceae bacterium]
MKTHLRIGVWVVLATLVTACGSTPPSRYYMLSADAARPPGGDELSIGVGPISIPDYLKNPGMIVGRDGHRLDISRFDRWAEPLEAGVTRVLALNLASMLDTRHVDVFPWRSDSIPDYAVQVGVAQFTARQDDALLVASWTILRTSSGELVEQSLTQYYAALPSKNPDQVAAVYSTLLLKLSEDIAAAIQRDADKT